MCMWQIHLIWFDFTSKCSDIDSWHQSEWQDSSWCTTQPQPAWSCSQCSLSMLIIWVGGGVSICFLTLHAQTQSHTDTQKYTSRGWNQFREQNWNPQNNDILLRNRIKTGRKWSKPFHNRTVILKALEPVSNIKAWETGFFYGPTKKATKHLCIALSLSLRNVFQCLPVRWKSLPVCVCV
jgi:hypothetical protein